MLEKRGTTEIYYSTVDVFTETSFGGNPLAVVFGCTHRSPADLQAIAIEFNYAETAFVLPAQRPEHTARVRIFTPTKEIPFAGHPSIGAAVALAHELDRLGLASATSCTFEEEAGLVAIRLLRENGVVVGGEFVAPQDLSIGARISVNEAAACLSLDPDAIVIARHSPQIASVGLPFLIVELASREALRTARPDLATHERLLPSIGTDAVFAYTLDGDCKLEARMFTPLDGTLEDPATGSATAATIALLAFLRSNGQEELSWRVSQGVDMGRPSVLYGLTHKNDSGVKKVAIGGKVRPVMRGHISL